VEENRNGGEEASFDEEIDGYGQRADKFRARLAKLARSWDHYLHFLAVTGVKMAAAVRDGRPFLAAFAWHASAGWFVKKGSGRQMKL
jgi:hypothetical protein